MVITVLSLLCFCFWFWKTQAQTGMKKEDPRGDISKKCQLNDVFGIVNRQSKTDATINSSETRKLSKRENKY